MSRVVARHMGIDLSPEGKAALNRRGIAIVVHGAPLSGKMLFFLLENDKHFLCIIFKTQNANVSISVQVKQGQQLLWLSTMAQRVSV